MKKFISITLVALMSVVALISGTGCGKTKEKIDTSKTQIYVNVLETGVGTEFATNLKQKFEQAHAEDTHWEANKKGVQVIISKSPVNGDKIVSALDSPQIDIYYCAGADISDLVTLSSSTSNYLEDITDIVTEGGEDSIHNRLFDSVKSYFNLGTEDEPKYFSLPWFSSYYGTVYDVGLFKERHLLSTDPEAVVSYAGLDGIEGNEDDNWGPDGKTDVNPDNGSDYTLDDGLPATWTDFEYLMEVMSSEHITPFVFTATNGYPESWLQALWIDYEGKDNYELAKTFDGTYTYTDADGAIQTLEINNDNGYEVAYQNGKKAAIYLGEKLINNDWYLGRSFNSTTAHTTAQEIFLKSNISGLRTTGVNQPIAFLMEGTWWENEAKDVFKNIAADRRGGAEYAYGTREFAYMPFPKFTSEYADTTDGFVPASTSTKTTMRMGGIDINASTVMLNKKSKQKALAKEFIKFAYSEQMNVDFTINSGVSMPLEYSIPDSVMEKYITPFQRNIFKYTQNDTVDVAYGGTRSKYMLNSTDDVKNMVEFESNMGGTIRSAVLSAFRSYNYTAEAYWNGVLAMNFETTWNTAIKIK